MEPGCDGDATRLLHPVATSAADARAYWLDDRTIRWPGQHADSRYRLLASTKAGLRIEQGTQALGADAVVVLQAAEAPTNDVAERNSWIGDGVDLALPAATHSGLRAMLSKQVILVREDADGRVIDSTYLQASGALDVLYASADDARPLGVKATDASTRLRLWAPTAGSVFACLYADGQAPSGEVLPMRRDDASGIWSLAIPRDLRGHYYSYVVEVFVPGIGIVRNRVTDPYSLSLTTDSTRSYIVNLEDPALKPDHWDDAPRPDALRSQTDMTIYELHVRDFSIGDASVPPAHRGKYLAFTDRDTNGMRHLRALSEAGITDIHLLPVFDIATIPEDGCVTPHVPQAAADSDMQQAAVMVVAASDCFNWGYDPLHYSAPEGSYATNAADGAVRIREFRAMVQALHAAGLRVGMDVVYNHTSESGQAAHSVLDRIVPGYYQRLDASGVVETSTCCANTATEHRMMAKLMRESVAMWARDYRIDSFRFDLMGHQPRAAMEASQRAADAAAGRHIPLIGEGWNFGEIANNARFTQAAQGELDGSGIATFSDRARDALRGGGCCDGGIELIANQGLLNGLDYAPNAAAAGRATRNDLLHAADLARAGLAGTLRDYRTTMADGRVVPLSVLDYKGQPAGYASQPGEVVNYVENHDNPTLWDVNALKLPQATSAEERARVQLLGAAFVAFSQGIAYFHAGFDLLRSKSLDRNSFNSGDWFNRLDWTYTDNGFAAGLPPKSDNGKDWGLLKSLLRNMNSKPSSDDIAWMRNAFRDILRIRTSTPLFHLRSAADVRQRLAFRNTGPKQNPLVVVGHLDGGGMVGPYREVLYLLNVSPNAQRVSLPEDARKAWVLHPVQASLEAPDTRPKQARHDSGTGGFRVPGRTVVVYVLENGVTR
ncbi:MAG: alpha-1,6-glucosidase domain-containing protein [Thermomonas sp.]